MRKLILVGCVMAGMWFQGPVSLAAGPDRPLELTPEQYAQLQQIQAESDHQAIVDVHASYSTEREERIEADRIANDITTGMWQATYPVVITILLIAAAPL